MFAVFQDLEFFVLHSLFLLLCLPFKFLLSRMRQYFLRHSRLLILAFLGITFVVHRDGLHILPHHRRPPLSKGETSRSESLRILLVSVKVLDSGEIPRQRLFASIRRIIDYITLFGFLPTTKYLLDPILAALGVVHFLRDFFVLLVSLFDEDFDHLMS